MPAVLVSARILVVRLFISAAVFFFARVLFVRPFLVCIVVCLGATVIAATPVATGSTTAPLVGVTLVLP